MGVHHELFAGLGVADGNEAEVGQVEFQRVEQAHGNHIVPAREFAQGLFPAGLADEVGHHEHGGALAHGVHGGPQQVGQLGDAVLRLGVHRRLQHHLHEAQHLGAATARRQHRVHHGLPARSVEHGAHAVAVAADQAREHGGEIEQHLALALLPGAEVHRGTEVEQEPGGHLAVFSEDAHVRGLQAGGDVPVDVAHVVVVLVLAQVGEVEAAAAHEGAVVALQQAVEPAQHGPLEPAQQRLGPARDRRGGGRGIGRRPALLAEQPRKHGHATFFSCSSGRAGAGMCFMTRPIRVSLVRPSDRPS